MNKEQIIDETIEALSREIGTNLMFIGNCKCGGDLMMYLKSEKHNICNYYCSKCDKVGTIKEMTDGDVLTYSMSLIVDTLVQKYGPDTIEEVLNTTDTE